MLAFLLLLVEVGSMGACRGGGMDVWALLDTPLQAEVLSACDVCTELGHAPPLPSCVAPVCLHSAWVCLLQTHMRGIGYRGACLCSDASSAASLQRERQGMRAECALRQEWIPTYGSPPAHNANDVALMPPLLP